MANFADARRAIWPALERRPPVRRSRDVPEPPARRAPGVFFWLAAACLALNVVVAAANGAFLVVAALSALAFYLVVQSAGLRQRSAAWRRAHDTSAVVAFVLAVLVFLRSFGLL